MKILVIGAHPADPFDLAGGTIYIHASDNNDEVTVYSITYGLRSHSEEYLDINRKDDELRIACSLLNVYDVSILGYLDEPYICNSLHVGSLALMIANLKPDVVITHHPNEYAHWDHSETGKLVCRALKASVKMHGYWVPTVYFFAVQFRPEVVRLGYIPQAPDILIDIGPFLDKKAEALRCFKSQGHDKVDWQKRFNSMESEMGRADGIKYSEGFSLYYPLKRNFLEVNSYGGFYNS